MKKLSIIFGLTLVLCFILSSAYADPNLYFDFNSDGVYDTSWDLNTGETVSVQIYVDDWDMSPFSSEDLFGVSMFLTYDETKIQVNRSNSFPNDSAHGGPFDPSFSIYNDPGGGEIQLEVANFNCVSITDRLLLYTVELEGIAGGTSNINISAGGRSGAITLGGADCESLHVEAAGGSACQINNSQLSTTTAQPTTTTATPATTTTSGEEGRGGRTPATTTAISAATTNTTTLAATIKTKSYINTLLSGKITSMLLKRK